jgi:hypothetical protein
MQVNTTDYHTSDCLTQYKLESVYGTLFLLLRDTPPEDINFLLTLPDIQTQLCLCWDNNDSGFRSEDLSSKWKGIAISNELSRMGMIALEDEGDTLKALSLLKVGQWIALTFKAMDYSPFITEGTILQF